MEYVLIVAIVGLILATCYFVGAHQKLEEKKAALLSKIRTLVGDDAPAIVTAPRLFSDPRGIGIADDGIVLAEDGQAKKLPLKSLVSAHIMAPGTGRPEATPTGQDPFVLRLTLDNLSEPTFDLEIVESQPALTPASLTEAQQWLARMNVIIHRNQQP